MIIRSDAIDFLYAHKADLVFLDPPFNIKQDYAAISDDMPSDKYERWLKDVLSAAYNAMEPNASLWLNLPDEHISLAVQFLKAIGLGMVNWCIWHYRFAQCQPHRFLRSKTHVVWFTNGDPCINPDAAQVTSLRESLYGDVRAVGTRMDFDVWGFDQYWGRVQGNSFERQPVSPNQIPERYMERVIGVSSCKGDLVLDPFSGSGTTHAVATAMERECLACDISQECVDAGNARRAIRV